MKKEQRKMAERGGNKVCGREREPLVHLWELSGIHMAVNLQSTAE